MQLKEASAIKAEAQMSGVETSGAELLSNLLFWIRIDGARYRISNLLRFALHANEQNWMLLSIVYIPHRIS